MVRLSFDLHIHSCLSPCGSADMTPINIVRMAALKQLDVIAVTDHNSCKNCRAVMENAKEYNIIAIPGMELCTAEEVHVLCLFPTLEAALEFDSYVYEKLIPVNNNETIFGRQEIFDKDENLIGTEPFLLINATTISFDEVDELMKQFDGILIPAHIDKPSNSLLSNLGMVPEDATFPCYEVGSTGNLEELCMKNPYLRKCNTIMNSDAHSLGAMKEAIHFIHAEGRNAKDLISALSNNYCNIEMM